MGAFFLRESFFWRGEPVIANCAAPFNNSLFYRLARSAAGRSFSERCRHAGRHQPLLREPLPAHAWTCRHALDERGFFPRCGGRCRLSLFPPPSGASAGGRERGDGRGGCVNPTSGARISLMCARHSSRGDAGRCWMRPCLCEAREFPALNHQQAPAGRSRSRSLPFFPSPSMSVLCVTPLIQKILRGNWNCPVTWLPPADWPPLIGGSL